MRSYKAISLATPLRDVCLVTEGNRIEMEQKQREAEAAAYERGRRDAEKALSEQLLQQRAEILELQQGVLTSLQNAVPRLIQDSEKALVDLTLELAQKIVTALPVTTEMIEAEVREAVSQLEQTTEISVQLHPEDFALLQKNDSKILNGLPGADTVRYASSPEVTRGGCIIHTRFGLLDARRETKIEQLRKSLA
jgi:Flagellar biosynthesis/type III secretory pathway protein